MSSNEPVTSNVGVVAHGSAAAFLDRAGGWLLEREAEHNLLLGIAQGLAAGGGAQDPSILLASVEQDGAVAGCAFRTPPHKLGLTRMPMDAVPRVVEAVAQRYPRIPAVLGPDGVAQRFAELWSELRGTPWKQGARQRIFQLEAVTWPQSMPAGRLRPATHADLPTVRAWVNAFADEVHVLMGDREHVAVEYVNQGVVFLWEDGWARSMAAVPAETPNGARIGYVYTPPEWRGRGYASACVAHLSEAVLESGSRYCFLYTDLANPVSNSIYQRMGYHPVADVVDCIFPEHADRPA
ncbi:MAG TPA: GNAT family N-acetyltransferase [Longimicrobiales bacterium]|nr:GNAT family N-acetyltransferase [Longimicrobiales bacterium]